MYTILASSTFSTQGRSPCQLHLFCQVNQRDKTHINVCYNYTPQTLNHSVQKGVKLSHNQIGPIKKIAEI